MTRAWQGLMLPEEHVTKKKQSPVEQQKQQTVYSSDDNAGDHF